MIIESRLKKLAVELKLVNNMELAKELGISRQYLSPLLASIRNGDVMKLIRHFDQNSPIDDIKEMIK